MTPEQIKQRVDELGAASQKLIDEAKELQAQCPHPEFEKGISLNVFIHRVLICTTCGFSKALNSDG